MDQIQTTPEHEKAMAALAKSPVLFVRKIWGLIPQPPRPEYARQVQDLDPTRWKPEYFGTYSEDLEKWEWYNFKKGEMMTWQQYAVLRCVELGLKPRISIRSGHGTGKTVAIAWLIFWGLLTHSMSQIGVTAPTADQLYDALMARVSEWHQKMPEWARCFFDVTKDHVRVVDSPDSWFMRARTASKENPEALAGLHSDFMMIVVDEASGVANEIFTTAEGAQTGTDILTILVSNPTRLLGYFFDTFNEDKANWINLHFSSIESPIVNHKYNRRILQKFGEDSDEYRIRVLGDFPDSEGIDEHGFLPLITREDLHQSGHHEFTGNSKLGLDPSGEGKNETQWVIRDPHFASILASEAISTPQSIALKTLHLIEKIPIPGDDIFVDNFGEGANVAQELALSSKQIRVNAVNVGRPASDPGRFINKRAELFWRLREWLKAGGQLSKDKRWEQLLCMRYRQTLQGKIQMITKDQLSKDGVESPDIADALSLTFWEEDVIRETTEQREENRLLRETVTNIDPTSCY